VESARRATTADVARVVELAHAMRVELEQERGGPLWATREARPEPLDPAYAALLDRDDGALLVGTYDDVVVGFGAAHVEVLRDGSRLGVIDEIYVEPEARAVGVGETLVERLVDFCRAAGCAGVDATALPGDREAKNFFERAGFSARLLVMHRSL
jgi:ribosomal protein S18 acetylase RimI-like enzyme